MVNIIIYIVVVVYYYVEIKIVIINFINLK